MPNIASPTGSYSSTRWAIAFIALALLSQLVLGALTAARLTVTHDEYWHVPVGLLNWKTGRFDFDPLNPPLLRMWGAVPLLFTAAQIPDVDVTTDTVRYGDAFLKANPEQFDRFVFLSRLPIVLLTVAAGALLTEWSWKWQGPWSACLVAWLWAREPSLLAHGSLLTTDAGAAAFWLVTLFLAWRFAVAPTRGRAVACGIVLGLAQAAKYTCVLLLPLMIVLWFVERWRNDEIQVVSPRRLFGRWSILLLSAAFVLNAVYLFRGTGTPLREFSFASQSARVWQERLGPLAALPVPFPKDYVAGIDRQKSIMEQKHPVFLDMTWNEVGFASYYPMTLLYKLPHSVQLLLIIAIGGAFWRRRDAVSWRRRIWFILPAGSMLFVASLSGMQLGIRYVLPALPFLFLLIGEVAVRWSWPTSRWSVMAVGILLLICDPWHVHPQYLAYFNELSGGSDGGRFHLLDSNLDWGQDLHELKKYLNEHAIEPIGLAYFGTLPPEALGIRYTPPPGGAPQPGWYAVSVNFVMGRPHVIHDGQGGHRAVNIAEYAYFSQFEPHVHLGASIDLFHITPHDVRRWHNNVPLASDVSER